MRRHWKCILLCLAFLAIGFLLGLLFWIRLWDYVDIDKKIGPWEIVYYAFSSLGAIGTCAAVVVALAKDSIIHYFSHPNVEVSLVDEEGISEEVDSDQKIPQANCYNCVLRVKNSGNSQAKTCSAVIENICYAEKKGKSFKEIKDYDNSNSLLTWEGDGVDLPKGIAKEIRLFNIEAPGSSVKPGEHSQDNPLIKLNGFNLKDYQSRQGVWEISYYISYDSGEHKHFRLTIEWDGTWKSRKTEMIEVLKVKLDQQ